MGLPWLAERTTTMTNQETASKLLDKAGNDMSTKQTIRYFYALVNCLDDSQLPEYTLTPATKTAVARLCGSIQSELDCSGVGY